MTTRTWLAAFLAACAIAACRSKADPDPAPEAAAKPAEAATVPVRVASISRETVARVVSAPGQTNALSQQKVRAPFAGTLVELTVIDGDEVRRGQTIGAIVSRDTEAALTGAREMQSSARTPAEKSDAERAVALAEQNLVRAAIRASADGVVLSHAAARGDRVSEDQEIVTIAERSSLVFVAGVAQSDLAAVRPGESVSVELAGRPRPIAGVVHDVLPSANPGDFTAPVRIDLRDAIPGSSVGLFGTARITVERHEGATVPEAAVLRDDVSGTSRVAVIRDGRAHWMDVVTGLRGSNGIEVVSPPLAPSDPVVVSGQVGLPDGARVTIRP